MTQRKNNKIIWYERISTDWGPGWRVRFETPDGEVITHRYIGYRKEEALKKARHESDPSVGRKSALRSHSR